MNHSPIDPIQLRVAELEAENARLRQSLDLVKAERKELREKVYGPFPEAERTTEAEMAEIMKNRVPGEGMKFFAEMGLLPPEGPMIPDPAPPFEVDASEYAICSGGRLPWEFNPRSRRH